MSKTKDKGALRKSYGAFRDGEKGDLVSAVGTDAGPTPATHPNKAAISPGSQFTTSPAEPLSGHQPVDPTAISGNSPVRSAGRKTQASDERKLSTAGS